MCSPEDLCVASAQRILLFLQKLEKKTLTRTLSVHTRSRIAVAVSVLASVLAHQSGLDANFIRVSVLAHQYTDL